MKLGFMKTMALVALAAWFVAPVANAEDKHSHDHAHAELPTLGVCVLMPTKDNKARGTLRLVQKGDELVITGKVRNLTPGEHGFHIHEFGDRRAADATSAGGHFNSHAGDLGNILADDQGVATVNVTTKDTALHFILGRSFVVHAGKDDLKSQPSGDAGPRVAVGIVGIGNESFKGTAKK